MTVRQSSKIENSILKLIGMPVSRRIDSQSERLEVPAGGTLCWAGDRLEHVYFPENAVLSVTTLLADRSAIETANIGGEGAFGLFEAMYTHRTYNQCLVLMPGSLIRAPFAVLRYLFENDASVRNLFIAYTVALRSQIEQAVACHALHNNYERMCRWLLTIHDRADGRDLPFTHEFLAHILGVSRKSVTVALQALEADALIRNKRGKIQILDRSRLERLSCECYASIKAAGAAAVPNSEINTWQSV